MNGKITLQDWKKMDQDVKDFYIWERLVDADKRYAKKVVEKIVFGLVGIILYFVITNLLENIALALT